MGAARGNHAGQRPNRCEARLKVIPVDRQTPHLGNLGEELLLHGVAQVGPLMGINARQGFQQVADRVVRVAHGAMAGSAGGTHSEPPQALLGRLDDVDPLAPRGRQGEPTHLADGLGDAVEDLRMVGTQPGGSERAGCLLVSEHNEANRTRRHLTATMTGSDG